MRFHVFPRYPQIIPDHIEVHPGEPRTKMDFPGKWSAPAAWLWWTLEKKVKCSCRCWMVERVPYQTAGIVAMDKFPCFEQTVGKFGSARLCCVLVHQVIFPSGKATYSKLHVGELQQLLLVCTNFLEKFYQILVSIWCADKWQGLRLDTACRTLHVPMLRKVRPTTTWWNIWASEGFPKDHLSFRHVRWLRMREKVFRESPTFCLLAANLFYVASCDACISNRNDVEVQVLDLIRSEKVRILHVALNWMVFSTPTCCCCCGI